MLEEKVLQMLTKELEQARSARANVLSNRQLLFTILIGAWSVLVTLLVFSLNKWGLDRLLLYCSLFLVFTLGSAVNIITILRLIVNVGELDITRIKQNIIVDILNKNDYFPDTLKLLNFDFGERYREGSTVEDHYSSFTSRFNILMVFFTTGNGIILFLASYSFLLGLTRVLTVVLSFYIPTCSYILLFISALSIATAWFCWMRQYYNMVKSLHDEAVVARIRKYNELIAPSIITP